MQTIEKQAQLVETMGNNQREKIMNVTLNLSSDKLDEGDLQALTRQLCHEINQATEINADLIAQETESENSKGKGLLQLGAIALSFCNDFQEHIYIASALVLIELIRMYIEKEPSLQFEVQKLDGTRIKVHCKNIEQMELILATLQSPESESSSAE